MYKIENSIIASSERFRSLRIFINDFKILADIDQKFLTLSS